MTVQNEMNAAVVVDCDFLVVGAGSSGCVLASRLVRQGLKVLIVEKGPADDGRLSKLVRRPSQWMAAALSGDAVAEVFFTEPQVGLDNRRLHAFRGRGGGGTSNVNSGLYCRGRSGVTQESFIIAACGSLQTGVPRYLDRGLHLDVEVLKWSKLVERKKDYEENWPWKLEEIEASFKSIESELTLEELPPTGTVALSCDRMLEEVGIERAPPAEGGESDEPTWTREGLGGCPMKRTTTKGGERQSAWSAFVKPVTTMPNLRIKDDATVSRVIIEGGHAVGIEVVESVPSWRGVRTRVRQLRLAKDTAEIILCCGVFRSPKLLMLSGIGPRAHLEEKGVPVVLDMPHVGEHLHDHLIIPSMNFSKLPMGEADYTEDSLHGQVCFSRELPVLSSVPGHSSARADGDRGGDDIGTEPTTNSRPSAVVGLLYCDGDGLARNLNFAMGLLLTQRGLLWAVLRTILLTLCRVVTWLPPITRILRNTRGALLTVTTVQSRGTVRLSSADAAAPPVIDPAYLSHPQDQQAACAVWRTFRQAKRETPAGKAVFGDELTPGKKYNYGNDDESFLRFVRDNCLPFYHPVGTCRMGKGAEDSVVSADSLRVHGVSGLRVADASVAPRIPSTPTQAMAMMIGDRAAYIALNDKAAKQQVQMRMVESANRSIN